jgi:glycosyltransferase involved in cell wall biosynthesis
MSDRAVMYRLRRSAARRARERRVGTAPHGEAPQEAVLRVLLVNWRDSGHPEGGGAESFLERVGSGLRELGHEVWVRCATYPGAAADEWVDGVRYTRRGGRFTVYPRSAAHLLARRRRYDVVIDVQNGFPFWTPLFTRALVVNVTHHVHREQWRVVFGPVAGRVGWWLESKVAPRVYARCPYVTVSEATRRDLVGLGIDADRVRVVYSGVDAPTLPRNPADWTRAAEPNLVVLGRLVPHKRVELAVDALVALREEFPAATLSVIGQGYWEQQLRDYAERAGVADGVRFPGFVHDATKQRLLAQAWLHVLPSIKEGWGLAVIESALHGTPTVAFASAGGTRESVLDGETGVLVDDDAEFIATVRKLIGDDLLRARLGEAARRHGAQFSWPATVRRVEAEIRALAGLPARPAGPAAVPQPRLPGDGELVRTPDRGAAAGQ